jgi:methylated-DNA-[protein]-cysteine S-methyltransferase
MSKLTGFHYTYDFGIYGLYTYNDHLAFAVYENAINCNYKETEVIKDAAIQLYEYSIGKRKVFNVQLVQFFGDEDIIERELYKLVSKIPYGSTKTYKQLAKILDIPGKEDKLKSYLLNNRLPIFVPCHRVIESKDDIGDYINGKEIKNTLLSLEAKYLKEK